MKRVIYSIYVDVPAKEHYGKSKHRQDTTKKANITVNAFKEHYKKLVDFKRNYANNIGATFMMFEYDLRYQSFEQKLLKTCPELTGYEIVNFYKIHLLCELAKEYDEILYLDFDAVPITKDSFFNAWDLSKGICVYNNNAMINKNNWPIPIEIVMHIQDIVTSQLKEEISKEIKNSYTTYPYSDEITYNYINNVRENLQMNLPFRSNFYYRFSLGFGLFLIVKVNKLYLPLLAYKYHISSNSCKKILNNLTKNCICMN